MHTSSFIALFTQDRLTIVVTHYDKYFDGDEDDVMDLQKVKEVVVANLRKVGLEASHDIIVPVSSEWAYQVQGDYCYTAAICMYGIHFCVDCMYP